MIATRASSRAGRVDTSLVLIIVGPVHVVQGAMAPHCSQNVTAAVADKVAGCGGKLPKELMLSWGRNDTLPSDGITDILHFNNTTSTAESPAPGVSHSATSTSSRGLNKLDERSRAASA